MTVREHLTARRRAALTVLAAAAVAAPAALAVNGLLDPRVDPTRPVTLSSDAGGQPLFTVSAMRAGQLERRCVTLTANGSDARVGLWQELPEAGVAARLRLRIERGQNVVGPSCGGFSPDVRVAGTGELWSGTLAGAPTTQAGAVDDPFDAQAGRPVSYRYTLELPSDTPNLPGVGRARFHLKWGAIALAPVVRPPETQPPSTSTPVTVVVPSTAAPTGPLRIVGVTARPDGTITVAVSGAGKRKVNLRVLLVQNIPKGPKPWKPIIEVATGTQTQAKPKTTKIAPRTLVRALPRAAKGQLVKGVKFKFSKWALRRAWLARRNPGAHLRLEVWVGKRTKKNVRIAKRLPLKTWAPRIVPQNLRSRRTGRRR